MDRAQQGAQDDDVVSLRPYPEAELEAMWADSESRYFGDLVGNGGLAEDEARAKAAKDTVWLRGLDPLLFEIEHEGARVGRVVLWLDAFEQPGKAWLFDIVLDPAVRGRGGRCGAPLTSGSDPGQTPILAAFAGGVERLRRVVALRSQSGLPMCTDDSAYPSLA